MNRVSEQSAQCYSLYSIRTPLWFIRRRSGGLSRIAAHPRVTLAPGGALAADMVYSMVDFTVRVTQSAVYIAV